LTDGRPNEIADASKLIDKTLEMLHCGFYFSITLRVMLDDQQI
jgi:hypothetical protein